MDKPAGISSFGVVARARRILSEGAGRKVKVGHAGTLDPFATGLLILLVGTATKQADKFLKLDKTYDATLLLGRTSSTGDPEGELSHESGKKPSLGEIEAVLRRFTGKQKQTPPAFSAIKVNGQRAYQLARKGREVVLKPREIEVYGLELGRYRYPELKLTAKVSSGTYIRSLAADIGAALGTGAYLKELRRTEIAGYSVKNARELEDFSAATADFLQTT